MNRNYKIDNIRLILIFLVVFGHLLECINGADALYRIIYSFHMPVFLFITGYFAKPHARKNIIQYCILYFIFQTLYNLSMHLPLQFTTPYWLLWYLFLIPFFYGCISIMHYQSKKMQLLFLFLSIVLSLLTGYDCTIGYYLSLSRFFTFLPFFLLGYYVHHLSSKIKDDFRNLLPLWCLKVCSLLAVLLSTIFIYTHTNITRSVLYGSNAYATANYNPIIKLQLLVIACIWIFFFWVWIPNQKIKWITSFGQNTLSIYLLHGFIIRLIEKYNIFCYTLAENLLLAILLTVSVMLLLGNTFTKKIFNRIFNNNRLFSRIQ